MTITIHPTHFHAEAVPSLLGQVGEQNSRTITVVQPTLPAAKSYVLLFRLPSAPNETTFADNDTTLSASTEETMLFTEDCSSGTVQISGTLLTHAGIVLCQWMAKNASGTMIAKSNLIPLRVEPSLTGVSQAVPTPEQLETKYESMLQQLEEAKQAALETIHTASSTPTIISRVIEYTTLDSSIISLTPMHNKEYRFTVTDSGNSTIRMPLLKIQQPTVTGIDAVFRCRILLHHFSAFQIAFADNLTGEENIVLSDGFYFVSESTPNKMIGIDLWYDGFGFRYQWYIS